MVKGFSRKLIEVEVRLGFLYIPKQGMDIFPEKDAKIIVHLSGEKKPKILRYNAVHRRIFGLTSWYKKYEAKPKDEVIVREIKSHPLTIEIEFKKYKVEKPEEEAKKLIDLSGLSSGSKGDITEDRIKELILLHGQGLLSVYKPVSDTEGIDLIVVKNGIFQPIFLQVKGRFTLTKTGAFIADTRCKTFKPHHTYFIVGAYFNPKTLEIHDYILFVPTPDLEKKALSIKAKREERYRITTRLDPKSKSKWSNYIIKKSELANKLLEKFEEISKYIK